MKMSSRTGNAVVLALGALICCGFDSPQGCQPNQNERIGPSGAEVGAAIAGVAVVVVGTIVLIDVNHNHHNIKGCVLNGPNGLQVQDGDKIYSLTGATAQIKAGDVVRVHGDRAKRTKASSGATFVVEKVSRDYGPCKSLPAPPAATAPVAATPGP
jgi:hypothetical protein